MRSRAFTAPASSGLGGPRGGMLDGILDVKLKKTNHKPFEASGPHGDKHEEHNPYAGP